MLGANSRGTTVSGRRAPPDRDLMTMHGAADRALLAALTVLVAAQEYARLHRRPGPARGHSLRPALEVCGGTSS